ncbi:uncharacterized protein BDR25DRAFT_359721 [Lindgomyces ingoldianus]|uniref:Uncharacterized protein n=1 Tax=Lindgomyces ingoldianus TaxID=673940 RepID=A0ACB6QJR0_9PLEO|nr:uncharacterized protein BDR25DRAFT_359721 [Lindgomyces ingoldianus]KAF2466370.1 hypothetical protein BDR25DRAFT_359721 [Lindgomyces ingoldianus]
MLKPPKSNTTRFKLEMVSGVVPAVFIGSTKPKQKIDATINQQYCWIFPSPGVCQATSYPSLVNALKSQLRTPTISDEFLTLKLFGQLELLVAINRILSFSRELEAELKVTDKCAMDTSTAKWMALRSIRLAMATSSIKKIFKTDPVFLFIHGYS